MITALCIVSASEITMVKPDFTYDLIKNNPEEFLDILHQFGMDVTQGIETQENLQHRNRAGNIVQCDRYVGYERTDREWITSGFASQEAKDKQLNNKILNDLYRRKGCT